MTLNPKRQRFIAEYLVDLNATQAAIRAGYSRKTAEVQGCRLLRNVQIQDAIAVSQRQRAERTGITQDRVLAELELLAFSDLTHYILDDHGNVQLDASAPVGAMRALQSIKRKIISRGSGKDREVTREVEIRLWDKPGPLKLAGQHVGLFAEQHERRGKDGKVIDRTVVTFGGRYKPAQP